MIGTRFVEVVLKQDLIYKDVLPAKLFGIAMFSVRRKPGKVIKKSATKLCRKQHPQTQVKVQLSLKHAISVVNLKLSYKDVQLVKKSDIAVLSAREEIGEVTEKTVLSLPFTLKLLRPH